MFTSALGARVAAVHAGTLTDGGGGGGGGVQVAGDRSSLFLCLFCSRNAHLCDPYYACYPGTAAAAPQQAVAAVAE